MEDVASEAGAADPDNTEADEDGAAEEGEAVTATDPPPRGDNVSA